MLTTDPVLERIAAYPWPRGGLTVRRINRGYSLFSTRTGAPVARLRPLGETNRVEVLWWRREAWGPAGPFGAVFDLDEALAFIADEPAFWIRA
ncbi:hypothetical protein M5E06_31085 [Azospirillum sp. A1-3]|uniref:hypothetical protein n=1 Tax=Azospirillum sp. A1-3 TaxID=185874 RepID=UPI0020772498|nr:hypothetical protein [Azospirillum sp. A1-3]MCM8738565.1 hypothetical protein [Azospirillum sp. A1-3]